MKEFFTGAGGVPGDYMYGTIHLLSLLILTLTTIMLVLISRKSSDKTNRKIVLGVAIFGLAFEIFWRVIYAIYFKQGFIELWPSYPCNLAGILIPIIAIINNKTLKNMFYYFAFIGGIVTFVYPVDIFVNSNLNFPILKSILQHVSIFIIPAFEYFSKTFKPQFKLFYLNLIGIAFHIINSEVVSRLIMHKAGDFMFFRSGLPFVIPGIPQFITLSVFSFIVLLIGWILLDIKGFKLFFNKNKS